MSDWSRRRYPVLDIIEVHDGDTFRLLLDVGFEDAHFPWLRLKDYSCPELNTDRGKRALLVTSNLLQENRDTLEVVTFRTAKPFKVKRFQEDSKTFGRYLGEVWLTDDVKLGDRLVSAGAASPGAFEG